VTQSEGVKAPRQNKLELNDWLTRLKGSAQCWQCGIEIYEV